MTPPLPPPPPLLSGSNASNALVPTAEQHSSASTSIGIESTSTFSVNFAVFGERVTLFCQLVEEAERSGVLYGEVFGPVGRYIRVKPGMERVNLGIRSYSVDDSVDDDYEGDYI